LLRTSTPIFIGEFNAILTGDPEHDAMRLQLLSDQLDIDIIPKAEKVQRVAQWPR
jgi:hypothetical protein